MTSSRFDHGSTSVQPQKPWISLFYGSMNGPGLKTLVKTIVYNMKKDSKKGGEEEKDWEKEREREH